MPRTTGLEGARALAAAAALQPYLSSFEGLPGYIAGLPSYPRNFSRDVILAGILAMDAGMLEGQIRIAAAHQGRRDDADSGEEAGKIHHELPGVPLPGRGRLLTTYSACDTTALWLLAVEALGVLDRERQQAVLADCRKQLILAVAYLLRHIQDDIFYEWPPFGASRFCLKVTYWKDSIVPDAAGRDELAYPVAYALAQFMAARGMLAAAGLLGMRELAAVADGMFRQGIRRFMQRSRFVAVRGEGLVLAQASSDELHSLAYIPAEYRRLLPLEAIVRRAGRLATPIGFACTPRRIATKLADRYHGYVVWPFEQALIHYGCRKFGLDDCAATAAQVASHIGEGQELLEVLPLVAPAGNPRQLWSVAAGLYFADDSPLRHHAWM